MLNHTNPLTAPYSVEYLAEIRAALGIPVPAYEYSGREIPYTWAEIQAKVQAGDYTGMRVGDYKDITVSGTFYDAAGDKDITIDETARMELAGPNAYIGYGDTAIGPCADFISRDCLSPTLMYNSTATNSGAYVGSMLYTTLNGERGIAALLPADVSAVIVSKRGLTEVKTAADASGWAWNDMGKLWLPTEQEVWGHAAWAEHGYGGGLSAQYLLFHGSLRHIIKGAGHGGSRIGWWCASSVAGSAANFCHVNKSGLSHSASATDAPVSVPLCFRVA